MTDGKLCFHTIVQMLWLQTHYCQKHDISYESGIILCVMITYFVLSCLRIHDISWYGVVMNNHVMYSLFKIYRLNTDY